jgi:anti-sigma28 factor (negative regulator of flagellin synthesis)
MQVALREQLWKAQGVNGVKQKVESGKLNVDSRKTKLRLRGDVTRSIGVR